jgi:DNA-directed RNA polymerase specialized sigma24 family protein
MDRTRAEGRQTGTFQFDDRHMDLLRSGDPAAEDAVVEAVFSFFDQIVRAVRFYSAGNLCHEDAEDVVVAFFADKFRPIVSRYRFLSARAFSAKVYRSLRNFALDWLDKKMRHGGRDLSIQQPVGDGMKTVEDMLPPWRDCVEGGLRPEEVRAFEKDVRDFLAKWAGDPVRQWILEACLFEGWTPKEASDEVPRKFPGKIYETGSVYCLVSRFRNDPELGRIREQYR